MQKRFPRFEALCREVVVAVTGEAEVDQFPELLALTIGHEPGTRADKAVQPLRPQVERDHLRIVLFEDEFHCQHRIFAGSRIFPKGEHDTKNHNNILLQAKKFNSKTGHFSTMSAANQRNTLQFASASLSGCGGSRRERQPDIRKTPEVCAHPRLSKCKFGTLKWHFEVGD